MSNEIEQIEARLTAYIDGQLAEKDRTEIEAYLAANPTHARLITELQRQRAQLRTLPRETVPAEIMDHLQAHLERHALLSDGGTSGSSMKINRWPQLGAVAAMLLLACGLGVLVYQVLPTGGVKPDQLVVAPPSIQQAPLVPPLTNDMAINSPESTTTPKPAPTILSAMRAEPTSPVNGIQPMADGLAMSKAVPPSTLPEGPLNNGSAIIVASDDPAMTRSLAATYLAEHGMAFEVAKRPLLSDAIAVPATEPAGARSVASVVEELESRQALPTTLPGTPIAGESGDMLIVRNLLPVQLSNLQDAIDRQRQGHQHAEWIDADDLRLRSQKQMPAYAEPAQDAAAVAESAKSASTQPVAPAAVARMAEPPPTTQSAGVPESGANSDVLIVFVAKAQATDANAPASTMPTTAPAPLPIPAPKPVPMIGEKSDIPSTTQPTTMP